MAAIGDRVQIESEKVGSAIRTGTVTAIDGRMITVRWDTGDQSVFVPSAGCLQVIGRQPSTDQPSIEPD
jgi:Domain of unknown function (DUF1918)